MGASWGGTGKSRERRTYNQDIFYKTNILSIKGRKSKRK